MKAFEDNQVLLEIELRNIVNLYFNGRFNFRCNVCGDSHKDKYKKRAYLLFESNKYFYFCHNCGYSSDALYWMKDYFPQNFNNYKRELFKINCDPSKITTHNKTLEDLLSQAKRLHLERTVDESEEVKTFKKITKFEKACEYCVRRKIPEAVWSKWFYSIDGFYKDRIIIPYYDNNNEIYYYTGRSLNPKNIVKYLSRRGENLNSCYNLYNIDNSKPVFIFEGPIDAIFCDNSVAMTGLKFSVVESIANKYFVLDNDATGVKHSIKRLQEGHNIFLWSKFLKDYKSFKNVKDFNDFILYNDSNITKIDSNMILKYFTNDIKDKIYLI